MARRFARDHLRRWGVSVDQESAILLVSEVATNAVVHGADPVTMRVRWSGSTLRICIADARPEPVSVVADVDRSAERGRGLRIVDELADRWGVRVDAGETSVWFELDSA